MPRKRTQTEGHMSAPEAITSKGSSYESLFKQIDSLQGKDRQRFTNTLTKEEKRDYINHCKNRDCEMVTGVFRSFEPLGSTLEMTGRAYHGETPTKYMFYDGSEHTVPKYIAKRFESEFQGLGTWYPTHHNILDKDGRPMVAVGKKNRRFGFSSMEFQ